MLRACNVVQDTAEPMEQDAGPEAPAEGAQEAAQEPPAEAEEKPAEEAVAAEAADAEPATGDCHSLKTYICLHLINCRSQPQ